MTPGVPGAPALLVLLCATPAHLPVLCLLWGNVPLLDKTTFIFWLRSRFSGDALADVRKTRGGTCFEGGPCDRAECAVSPQRSVGMSWKGCIHESKFRAGYGTRASGLDGIAGPCTAREEAGAWHRALWHLSICGLRRGEASKRKEHQGGGRNPMRADATRARRGEGAGDPAACCPEAQGREDGGLPVGLPCGGWKALESAPVSLWRRAECTTPVNCPCGRWCLEGTWQEGLITVAF